MKKVFSIFICLSMVLSMSVGASASDDIDNNIGIDSSHPVNEIAESFNTETMSISRSYSRKLETSLAQAHIDINNGFANTKSLLSDLGIKDCFIEKLSEEELIHYATTPYIYTSNVYMIASGSKMVPVTMDRYIQAVADIDDEYRANDSPQVSSGVLNLTFVVSKYSDVSYKFYTFAEWPELPYLRGAHTIGAVAQSCTTEYSTAYGWYEYTVRNRDTYTGGDTSNVHSFDINSSMIKDVSENVWYGMVGIIDVPRNDYGNRYITEYSNLRVSFGYVGKIQNESATQNFNATGGYSISDLVLSPSLSISIGIGNNIGMTIGLSANEHVERYGIDLPYSIHYEPSN